ncbi:TOMM system kinase/cyclase fusion protein [Hyalangium versicolor]|uniref:TOMM system kinase/cyclase fusion protein n=1 Tax=Hyalangium versicolor TaxID=2861190 RepID=UPI001CCB79E8|nr:TOMM system kinase/cyclase fusion protein [Hyalangium versicolor]
MRDSTPVLTRLSGPLQERYELLGLVGQGGFGQVYKARQVTTEQEVAVKILRPPAGGSEHQLQKQLARFRREMRICSRLFHPNLVRPIDSGQTEEGLLYSVFEFVPGENLADVLAREGALEPREALRLMIQVLDALDCAHRRGVVHRDIKPQNIMITDTGARRNAMVLDFGLSTLVEEFNAEDVSGISSIFEVLGTPAYAAPEQLRGQHPDMRSDLYSWGLVHLECLTGEMVMKGRSVQEVLEKQIGPEPVPIPETLEGLRLGELLRRATVKDIDKRNVTAAELIRELDACTQEEASMVVRRFAMARTRAAPASKKNPGSSSLLSGEHLRQITVLCCGLNVLPLLAEQEGADVEERDSALRAQQKRCTEIAEEFGGYLVPGGLGQEVMIYFGYPTAREDAPRSAARAALRILEDAALRKAELETKRGLWLELRIGIHTGLSIVRDPLAQERQDFPIVLGTTPTIASQHQEMAEPGESLVSQDTYRLLRDDFVFETVRRVEPRTHQPVEVRRLDQPRASESSRFNTPLVGREGELRQLLKSWDEVRQGVGQGVLITGEPGIGKSRLVKELYRSLRGTPFTLLECRCASEDRTSTLRPIIDMLDHLLGRGRDWSAERCRSELEAMLSRYGFELEEAMPLFASLLSIPLDERFPPLKVTPEWQKALTFDAVLNLLVEIAAQQPVLMVVEDLHWADATTLELLMFLLESVSTARLGVFFTARSSFVTPWGASQTVHLQLGRLSREHVATMVEALAGGARMPARVAEQVAERTDGIPLFVEELTRMVLESQEVKPGSKRERRVGTLSGMAIPGTLRGLLEARLDRLGRAKETAELASLLGREFNYELLRALSPLDDRTLQADLSTLVASDLLQHRRRLHDSTYVFRHALIKEAAYESIPRATRRELHSRIASVLEERFPALVESRPELLAWHHAAADQKSRALWYEQLAARKALLRSANAEAIAHANLALEYLDALPEQGRQRMERELEINSILIPALMSARGWPAEEIQARSRRSQELIDALGHSPHAAQALWALFSYHHCRGEFGVAKDLVERLLAQAKSGNDTGLHSLALCIRGELHGLKGQLNRSVEDLTGGLGLYDVVQHQSMAQFYGLDARAYGEAFLGMLKYLIGSPKEALVHALDAVKWARQINHPITEGTAIIYLVSVYHFRGEKDAIPALAEHGIKLAERYGLPVIEAYNRILLAWARHDVETLARNLDKLREWKMLTGFSYYTLLLIEAEFEVGRYASARQHAEEILQWARQSGETYCVPFIYEVQARILHRLGDQKGAREALDLAIQEAQEQGAVMPRLRAAKTLGRLWNDSQARARAREVLEPLLRRFSEDVESQDVREARALILALPREEEKPEVGVQEARPNLH